MIFKEKVFGIGLNKTGTTSLGQALEILGFDHFFYNQEITQIFLTKGFNNDIKEILKANNSFEDFPWPIMWRELAILYPESKFILTVRMSKEVWYESQVKHYERYKNQSHLINKAIFGRGNPKGNSSIWLKFYEQHNKDVITYFKENAPNRFCILNFEQHPNWEKLCSFLNKPIPKESFPHANSSKIPISYKYFWKGNKRKALTTIFEELLSEPIRSRSYFRSILYNLVKKRATKSS